MPHASAKANRKASLNLLDKVESAPHAEGLFFFQATIPHTAKAS